MDVGKGMLCTKLSLSSLRTHKLSSGCRKFLLVVQFILLSEVSTAIHIVLVINNDRMIYGTFSNSFCLVQSQMNLLNNMLIDNQIK